MPTFDDPLWVALCVTVGVAALLAAIHHAVRAHRGPPDTPVERPRTRRRVRALRALLSGLCLLGLAYGLAADSVGWVVASLAIGLEELYETTMALSVLGWCERVAAEDAARPIGTAAGSPR